MPEGDHQFVNLALAGVRSARASTKQGEPSEPWGEEVRAFTFHYFGTLITLQAKFFAESRILQRFVRVQLLSLPTSTATPFQAGATAAPPPPASIFIGSSMSVKNNERIVSDYIQLYTLLVISPNTSLPPA